MSEMKVVAVSTSETVGVRKTNRPEITLIENAGAKGDAHAGLSPKRQVSLLAMESIRAMNEKNSLALVPGDYAENITTEGLVLHTLPLGTRLEIGEDAILEISQIGKTCHHGCAIKESTGTCIMPTQGVFGAVTKGGVIRPGDRINIFRPGRSRDHLADKKEP